MELLNIVLNPFETASLNDIFHTIMCSWFTLYYMSNKTSRFSSNSEANASELLENLEEMYPRYHIHCYVYSTTLFCAIFIYFVFVLYRLKLPILESLHCRLLLEWSSRRSPVPRSIPPQCRTLTQNTSTLQSWRTKWEERWWCLSALQMRRTTSGTTLKVRTDTYWRLVVAITINVVLRRSSVFPD